MLTRTDVLALVAVALLAVACGANPAAPDPTATLIVSVTNQHNAPMADVAVTVIGPASTAEARTSAAGHATFALARHETYRVYAEWPDVLTPLRERTVTLDRDTVVVPVMLNEWWR